MCEVYVPNNMCYYLQDNPENGHAEQQLKPAKREIVQRQSEAKWYYTGEKINANIRYFEPRLQNEKDGKMDNNYDVITIVKNFQVYTEPTPERGTSLLFVHNMQRKNQQTQVDLNGCLGDIDERPARKRSWSLDVFHGVEERKDASFGPQRRSTVLNGPRDSVDMRRNKLTVCQKHSDAEHCSDVSKKTARDEQNENYQNYSQRSDNLLSKQISKRFNSTTCLQFSQFYLTRNGERISVKLTDEEHEQLDFVTGPRETLWQKLPQVLASGCLETMTLKQIKLQESLFEIVYSEGRYLHSLQVLDNIFITSIRERIPHVITEHKFNVLFSKVEPILKSVEIFMDQMNNLLEHDAMLRGLCDIIQTHYRHSWDHYLKYAKYYKEICNLCQNEKNENPVFAASITALSNIPAAEKLPLDSFLSLPIQRITKLRLLLKSVITQADENDDEYMNYLKTLNMAEKLATRCNKEVDKLEECEEMLKISQEIEFSDKMNLFPLITKARKLCIRSPVKRTCTRLFVHHKERIEMFLFNDFFLFARKSMGHKRLVVCEYCPRSALTIVSNTSITPLELQLRLQSNSQGKESTLVVLFESMSERQRWVTALTPPSSIVRADKQVMVKKRYTKKRPDELNLEIGDLINIIHENGEWCNGKRLIDGEIGWFPLENCHLITSEVIRNITSRLCLGIQLNSERGVPS